ncbi:hypothetical protein DL765_002117 [Monosporascus sp. GIB2]|nr:hypothetical protein DL765_002117 [Monosporascus sp. GIB2]
MPLRVRSLPMAVERPPSPHWAGPDANTPLPDIGDTDSFREVVKKISRYIAEVVYSPSTFEQLRTTSAGDPLRTLVDHLTHSVTNPATVNALLALRWHYGTSPDERGVGEARANACEIVAWRFLTRLSEREVMDFCLYEIPQNHESEQPSPNDENREEGESDERTSLLRGSRGSSPHDGTSRYQTGSLRRDNLLQSVSKLTMSMHSMAGEDDDEDDPTAPFVCLNALEIAAIADAKRFLSQHVVQKIITDIWNGEIIFWDRLSAHSTKKPRFYNRSTADPFSRLRVPKYLKAYEVMFFGSFLGLYYGVLIEQNRYSITPLEILLYTWFAAFFYDEISEYIDAGSIFYATDVWNLFDMCMIAIGIVFAVLRFVGLSTMDYELVDIAFDVLSLEALFMVPRICSVLSLSPYWGTLIPCLKEMGKDFLKFMVLVAIIYLGFLTTFSLVGRATFSFPHMAMIVTKIFFGSSYVGFDMMDQIDPIFGPPLMFIFVTLSSILLMGSLTGMLSNSFSRVILHAREEYLYIYSVYVLEASTSNRLTHFYPPFNLLALGIFRPLRLFLPSDGKFRQARIILLKATHAPIVGVIKLYEWISSKFKGTDGSQNFRDARRDPTKRLSAPPAHRHDSRPPSGHRHSMLQPPQQRGGNGVPKPRPRDPEPDDFVTDAPTDVEVQISELASKIDRLTALVVALQSGAGTETVRT